MQKTFRLGAHALVLFAALAATAASAEPLPQPAHVVTTNLWDVFVHVAVAAGALFPAVMTVAVAFYRRDRDKWLQAFELLPQVYNAVNEAWRRGHPTKDAQGAALTKEQAALEILRKANGGRLTGPQEIKARTVLNSIHAQIREPAEAEAPQLVVRLLPNGAFVQPGRIAPR